jgi:phenylalanyl-tRNA synthetase beta chain
LKISLNWLKDYVDLSAFSVEEVAHKLTMAGLEIEDIADESAKYKGFIVAFVKDRQDHPNSDHLSICTVFTGKEELQVVCGAPNVAAGQKIIFAPIGTVIPNGDFKITKAKIRGVESFGMICSDAELDLSPDHSGIRVLDSSFVEGTPIADALNLNDVVFEVGITPNRPDALSHIGVARDAAALFEQKLKYPVISITETAEKIQDYINIEVEDTVNCPRYTAKVVTGVEIKESPDWLKKRLTQIGVRPINNIVDITNYVMFESGQPLHAFDLDRLKGKKIIVKSTSEESKFTTLDSKERTLPVNSLMICDAEKPVAVAGVMGGENSEIYSDTKNVLIESAYFHPSSIRRTAKLLGLSSEASYRFERGCDFEKTKANAERAAQLMADLGNGKIVSGIIDCFEPKIERKVVSLRFARVSKILGYEVSPEEIISIMKKLEFEVLSTDENSITVTVPGFRPDVEREIDLIEEIARIYGYDNIPVISKINVTLDKKTDDSAFVDSLKNYAAGLGFYEMINNPLQSEKTASIIGKKIAVKNPQSLDMAFLRTSLVPGTLNIISENIKVGEKNLKLFEIGHTFNKLNDEEIKSFSDFEEKTKMIIALTGKEVTKNWNNSERGSDFYSLKGCVESILNKMRLKSQLTTVYPDNEDSIFEYHFTKTKNSSILGVGGKVNADILKKFDIQQDVYCFEFDIDEIKKLNPDPKAYIEPSKFPKVLRDFAFIFAKNINYQEIIDYIYKESSKLLKSAEIFDLFESDSLGKDNRSIAINLEYYSNERTLKEEEVEKDFNKLIQKIITKFNATLRG